MQCILCIYAPIHIGVLAYQADYGDSYEWLMLHESCSIQRASCEYGVCNTYCNTMCIILHVIRMGDADCEMCITLWNLQLMTEQANHWWRYAEEKCEHKKSHLRRLKALKLRALGPRVSGHLSGLMTCQKQNGPELWRFHRLLFGAWVLPVWQKRL